MTQEEYGIAYQAQFERTVLFLQSRAAPKDLAEDLAQAAWVRGLDKRGQLRDPTVILTWVNSIALNLYRQYLRKESFVARCAGELKRLAFQTATIDVAEIDLRKILSLLRPQDRLLLEQCMAGMTMAELAWKYDISEIGMRVRCLRARQIVREKISVNA